MAKKLNKLGVENSLWNNIRANKGSGKAPTKEMLKQERKINAKYADGGTTEETETTETPKKPLVNWFNRTKEFEYEPVENNKGKAMINKNTGKPLLKKIKTVTAPDSILSKGFKKQVEKKDYMREKNSPSFIPESLTADYTTRDVPHEGIKENVRSNYVPDNEWYDKGVLGFKDLNNPVVPGTVLREFPMQQQSNNIDAYYDYSAILNGGKIDPNDIRSSPDYVNMNNRRFIPESVKTETKSLGAKFKKGLFEANPKISNTTREYKTAADSYNLKYIDKKHLDAYRETIKNDPSFSEDSKYFTSGGGSGIGPDGKPYSKINKIMTKRLYYKNAPEETEHKDKYIDFNPNIGIGDKNKGLSWNVNSGLGLSYDDTKKEFSPLIDPSASIGYDFNKKRNLESNISANINRAGIEANLSQNFKYLKPSVGVGYNFNGNPYVNAGVSVNLKPDKDLPKQDKMVERSKVKNVDPNAIKMRNVRTLANGGTILNKGQEIAYNNWLKNNNITESEDYDMKGYWKEKGFLEPKHVGHFDDTYKVADWKPFTKGSGDNYPAISEGSKYSGNPNYINSYGNSPSSNSSFDKRGQGFWDNKDNFVTYAKGGTTDKPRFPGKLETNQSDNTRVLNTEGRTVANSKLQDQYNKNEIIQHGVNKGKPYGFENQTIRGGMESLVTPDNVMMATGVGALAKAGAKALGRALTKEEMVNLYRIQEKGGKTFAQNAAEGRVHPLLNKPEALAKKANEEKYFGQWFTKDKNDLKFYSADREFVNPEMINLKVPASKLPQFQNYDKMLSRAPEREFVIPQDMQKLYRYTNGGTTNPGFNALPQNVQQKILNNMGMGGPVLGENMYPDGGLTDEPNNGPRNSLTASGNFETNPNMSKYGLNSEFSRAFGQNRNLNLGVNANLGATYNNMPATQEEFSMPMTPTVEPTANFGATGSYHSGNNNFNANVNYNPYNQGVEGKVTYTKKFNMGGMTSPKYRYDNGKFLPMHGGIDGSGTVVGTPPPTKWGANAAKANPNATALAGMAPAVMEVANTFVNQNTDPELSGALDWGAKGMAAGSAFGPYGAIIGGTAGFIGGGAKGIYDRDAMNTANTEKKIAAKNAADFKTVMGNADTTNMGVIQANTGSQYSAFGGTKYNGRIYGNGGMTVINKDHSNPQEEVEGGESAMLPNGKNVQFNGPKHTNGGIKTSLPEGTRIFSDQLIYPGKR